MTVAENIKQIRADFPVLTQTVNGKPLVYLDNAATSQKPLTVIDAITDYYHHHNANVHRGVHALSQRATTYYEQARQTVRDFIHAKSEQEIIFVRGATEAINLVANSFVRPSLKAGDTIVVSHMEHHANIVPWQQLCEETGANLLVIPMTTTGELDLSQLDTMLTDKTKIVAINQVSNALGTVNPVKVIIEKAKQKAIPVLVDGAQAVPHMPADVQALDCDFYVFSGHKMYAPTGIGVLYGKKSRLEAMPPWQSGGDMILSVTFEKTLYNDLPYKFEAGTPNIAGAIGLAKAIDYMHQIGLQAIADHEQQLLNYATEEMMALPDVDIIANTPNKVSVLSFMIQGVHPHDVGTILDQEGVAIRAGHHCAQPVMQFFNIPATARASFAFYNTPQEVDSLIKAIRTVKDLFS
ncbi:MAG TPA: cysteine desulfurase CsdA [Gammaproteobacteria bacterium]|nr:cysteine desulfurase CsdA [Gammaproteobacteria bacterium]